MRRSSSNTFITGTDLTENEALILAQLRIEPREPAPPPFSRSTDFLELADDEDELEQLKRMVKKTRKKLDSNHVGTKRMVKKTRKKLDCVSCRKTYGEENTEEVGCESCRRYDHVA